MEGDKKTILKPQNMRNDGPEGALGEQRAAEKRPGSETHPSVLVSQGLDQLWPGKSNEFPHHPLATIIPSPTRLETQPGAGDTLFHLCPFLNTPLLSEPEHIFFSSSL